MRSMAGARMVRPGGGSGRPRPCRITETMCGSSSAGRDGFVLLLSVRPGPVLRSATAVDHGSSYSRTSNNTVSGMSPWVRKCLNALIASSRGTSTLPRISDQLPW